MSFLTCFWLLPQNEHFRRSAVSPMRATWEVLSIADSGPIPEGRQFHPSGEIAPRLGHRSASWSCLVLDRRHLEGVEHLVDEPVLDGLLGREDLVAVDVLADLFDRLAGGVGQHLFHQLTHPEDLV